MPKVFRFPASRRLFARLLGDESSGRRPYVIAAGWWLLTLAVLPIYATLRGHADNLGAPVHGSGAERAIFGTLPTLKLQEWIWGSGSETLEWGAVIIHSSWFFVPLLAGALVTIARPRRVGSYVRWWIALEMLAVPLFALFPMRPPWMESDDVTRIIALRFGGEIQDSNPLAAMPSLHVAFPLLLALWFTRERWMAPASALFAYTALIAAEVVFSGEHYVVDVAGAVALAFGIAALARVDYRAVWSRIAALAQRASAQGARTPQPLSSERGQALIELAFILPVMLVFLLVLVDFGLAMDRREVIQHAAREGARQGAVGLSAAGVQAETVDQSQDVLTLADVSVCYVDGPDAGTSVGNVGDNVRVTIDYDYDFTAGSGELLATLGLGPPSIHMNPHAEARLETTILGAPSC